MDLTNASAIATGGACGFGSATVRRLAQKGAKALTVRATRSATSENAVPANFAEHSFRNCLEIPNSPNMGTSMGRQDGLRGLFCRRTSVKSTAQTPPLRFSKQFRKGRSPKFA
jgi:NAD(P)-dependent dehydrogenase (short-subunit alcohol dehydrogenase family)